MSHSDRRGFLKISGALSAVSVAPARALTNSAEPLHLQRQHFAPLMGQVFEASGSVAGGASRRFRLAALESLPHSNKANDSFRAVFEAVDGPSAAQDLWQLSHPALGSHAVFMSPNDASGLQVEAVFNRG